MRSQQLPQQPVSISNIQFDSFATEAHYQHYKEYDFEESDRPILYPHASYGKYTMPAQYWGDQDWQSACPKLLAEQEHKQRNPLFCIRWKEGGKRVVTGSSNGDIIIWHTPNFEYEKSNTVHKERVHAMCWSNYEKFLISGDKAGVVIYSDQKISEKYKIKAHPQTCIRDLSFSLSSMKFVSCSDDRTAKIFDFPLAEQELTFEGHGSDVTSCEWHPFMSLVVTGSKDNNVKLWDPRSGKEEGNIHAHNNTINQVRWNPVNGNWLLTGSRDKSIKVHDVRTMKDFNTFQGHNDQITVVAWHPFKEELFASADHGQEIGNPGGSIIYWLANYGHLNTIDKAHNTMIWGLAWHPLGHMIASTGNDHKIRFWGRCRPNEIAKVPISRSA